MGKIIAFCNQKGGVGKTTSAINISAYVADTGKKVLLIDSDPQANATSGVGLDKKAQRPSVYDLLMGLCPASESIVSGPMDNLFVIPSNVALTGAEIELVDQPAREYKLEQALAPLREQFDFIFIDTPPVAVVSDTLLLTGFVDINIFVVRQRYSSKNTVELIQELYQAEKLKNMGIIINDISLSGYYGYGLRYGYYRGYGYSYGKNYYGQYSYGKYGYSDKEQDYYDS